MLPRSLLIRARPTPSFHLAGPRILNVAHDVHVAQRRLASASRPSPELSPESSSRPSSSVAPASTSSSPQPKPSSATTPAALSQEKSWLTRKVENSPGAKKAFMGFAKLLGYGSARQLAARRAFVLYEKVCAVTPEEDAAFWREDCFLPPTFQSWFTVTNLHIWMLTVRLRALPSEHGAHYVQALIDHFFIDIEDRIRAVLQPKPESNPSTPYTFHSDFYVNPNASKLDNTEGGGGKKKLLNRAPDRIVTRQMKIFKEQWAGLGLAFDLALVKGDMEMAAAIWRNVLGARGAQGIDYPQEAEAKAAGGKTTRFRRAVNLVGGEVVNVAKVDLEKEQVTDDGSGVHDFAPAEVDKYLGYPETMLALTQYVRRELARLDAVSDRDIMLGDWEKLRFGQVLAKKERGL